MRQRRRGSVQRVTMSDVARVAEVSPMTVSRALNQPDAVRPELRERVQEAVRKTGYIHDRIASALASHRSGMIAVILPTIASSMFSDSVRGISEVARARGAQIVLAETNYSVMEEEAAVAALLGRRPDGFIVIGTIQSERTRSQLVRAAVPVVETWDTTEEPVDSLIAFSNRDAAQAMTEALADLGYQRIAFAGVANGDRRARLREEGYRAGLTARALHAPQVVYVEDLTSMRSGALVADMVTALAPQPDALFCLNDVLAAGALLALQRKGLRVPDALGVAGFGGFDFAEHLVPSLTTVDVPRYAIGHEAACVLMDRIEGLADAHKISRTEFQICLRESTRDIIL
ncbi:LacI family DNA-binding transcriptional regulator [Methylobacterium dankookense]|uniref:HTH-type transcriptional regulator GntR n=1 Tax=Methylobacterium dankookense TaxID=560405 RepID=A0A564FWD0_9HYPH|nr:LacI family DNA-binding transcriptional regulator [Methylobacterium dankookense]GJD55078.1 HTH-type transcriptional regulator GntR [Methylobacterium dankookense]VUF12076.1 HTH-type transcriptional regulator GntR [Methylobacterium dankookense]